MARSRTRKTAPARTVRFVKNPRPVSRRRTTAARPRTHARRANEPGKAGRTPPANTRMPGWGELEKDNRREGTRRGGLDRLFATVSTVRLSLYTLSAAILVTLYVGHVHATQNLAEEVRSLRKENLSLHLRYNRVKGAYDRASGPQVIHERARRLGLTESLPNGYPVIID